MFKFHAPHTKCGNVNLETCLSLASLLDVLLWTYIRVGKVYRFAACVSHLYKDSCTDASFSFLYHLHSRSGTVQYIVENGSEIEESIQTQGL